MVIPTNRLDGTSPILPQAGGETPQTDATGDLKSLRGALESKGTITGSKTGTAQDAPMDRVTTKTREDGRKSFFEGLKSLFSDLRDGLSKLVSYFKKDKVEAQPQPQPQLPKDKPLSPDAFVALGEHIASLPSNPGSFLRTNNSFSTEMKDALLEQVPVKDIAKSVLSDVASIKLPEGVPTGRWVQSEIGGKAADYAVSVASSLLQSLVNKTDDTSYIGQLPDSFKEKLQKGAETIRNSGLPPNLQTAAIRSMVKDVMFLRSMNATLTIEGRAGNSGGGIELGIVIFNNVVNDAKTGKFSADLQQKMAPLKQGFDGLLDQMVQNLGLNVGKE